MENQNNQNYGPNYGQQNGYAPQGQPQQPNYSGYQQQPQGQQAPQSQSYYASQYGQQNQAYQPYQPQGQPCYAAPKQPSKGMGIAAMILGIASIALFWTVYMAMICAIIGLILGIIGRRNNRTDGMALAGIITSAIGLAIFVLILVLAISLIGTAANSFSSFYDFMSVSARMF